MATVKSMTAPDWATKLSALLPTRRPRDRRSDEDGDSIKVWRPILFHLVLGQTDPCTSERTPLQIASEHCWNLLKVFPVPTAR